ncbi:MAG TPA: hypothetical protein VK660_08605, partial [Xanthomonadaceae bacterium]|nr:hypothetical protein [Xanthomonadaceae bacterium]
MNAQVSTNRFGAVVGAFFYLQGTSLYNRLKQRLLRLRQPKYLFGSLAAGAYMYFFFFRRLIQGGHSGRLHAPMTAMTPEVAAQFAALAAVALSLWVVADWVLSG